MIPVLKGDDAIRTIKNLAAPACVDEDVAGSVSEIIADVRKRGDAALKDLARRFGEPEKIALTRSDIDAAVSRVNEGTRKIIEEAAENIRVFADAVVRSIRPVEVERNGWTVGLEHRPVESTACYVPGGRYPLPSSALMTAVTAKAAGVKEIAVTSPKISDEVVFAGVVAGADRFYMIGGAQAVAALAFGTRTVGKVDMIVGPGNAYVTEAKRQLQGVIGIDMLAGPSEVIIIADAGADPAQLAIEMLAQAEHDPEARAWLLTDSETLAEKAASEIKMWLSKLDLPGFVKTSIKGQGIFVFKDIDECAKISDTLAPEHLVLAVKDPEKLKLKLTNFGALFMGYDSTVAFGDYMSGPNHTLPTGRTARFSEGLNPGTFLLARSYFRPDGDISGLAASTCDFAKIEGLAAHAEAARQLQKTFKKS